MSEHDRTRIPVRSDTRDQYLKPLLQGGETYDSLIRRLVEQYEPPNPKEEIPA